ncbi:MAG: hypothetical protein ACKV2Q_28890 [Planctomycetaceae bacterium]
MNRLALTLRTIACCCLIFCLVSTTSAADLFDRHSLVELKLAAKDDSALDKIAAATAAKWKPLSPRISAPCLIVRTNDGHWSKALLAWGQRKLKGREQPHPVLVLERFVTYRSDREGQTTATGKDVMLFGGHSFSFDIGQVVPTGSGADIEFTETGLIKPLGEAKLFALNGSQLAAADATKPNPNDHEGVLPRDFVGTWKVSIDGRWTGTWEINVDDQRTVFGKFISDDTQSRYELYGKVSNIPHQAKLEIDLANTNMSIEALLFNSDKSTMSGSVVMANRKIGFIAKRQE